jgi:hypothetical protein
VLTNVVVTNVKPLERKNHVATIDPTDVDMPIMDVYVPALFEYKLEENSDAMYEKTLNRIKGGLQKVVLSFFSWAGRSVAIAEGMGRQLLCDDGGISKLTWTSYGLNGQAFGSVPASSGAASVGGSWVESEEFETANAA